MTLKVEVTAFKDRRRAGFSFGAGQATPVELDGPDDPRLEALEGDPVLNVVRQSDAETEPGQTAPNGDADQAEKQLLELKAFLAELEEKPPVGKTSEALGFKVTGAQITDVWDEIQTEKSGS